MQLMMQSEACVPDAQLRSIGQLITGSGNCSLGWKAGHQVPDATAAHRVAHDQSGAHVPSVAASRSLLLRARHTCRVWLCGASSSSCSRARYACQALLLCLEQLTVGSGESTCGEHGCVLPLMFGSEASIAKRRGRLPSSPYRKRGIKCQASLPSRCLMLLMVPSEACGRSAAASI
jgi:hypothetical protein